MRAKTAEHLRAPNNGARLELQTLETSGDEVVSGRLIDSGSGAWYRIEEGIADLVPHGYRSTERYAAFCRKYGFDQGIPPSAGAAPDKTAATQIKYFAEHRDDYEAKVVASPFYDVLDRVTLGRWVSRTISKGMLVAEIGCGTGRQTLPLINAGADVIAVDLSEDMLRLARRKALTEGASGRADFVAGTAENLPLASNTFDAAVVFGSLHHFSDPPLALQKVAEIMKPGSHFYMLEPHKSPVRFIFDWMMRRWTLWEEEANDEPLFEESQFRTWLGAGGLDTEIKYSTFLPPHLFYVVRSDVGDKLLVASDALFNFFPGLRRFGGVIIAEATRRS